MFKLVNWKLILLGVVLVLIVGCSGNIAPPEEPDAPLGLQGQDTPVPPGEEVSDVLVEPTPISEGGANEFATNEGNCESAALTQLGAPLEAESTEQAMLGEFMGIGEIEDALLGGYTSALFMQYDGVGHAHYFTPDSPPGQDFSPWVIEITGPAVCRSLDGGTARFWPYKAGVAEGWVLESIRWENYEFTQDMLPGEIQGLANEINAGNNDADLELNVEFVMDELSIYFWKPYVEPGPIAAGGEDIASEGMPEIACDLGAPSYLYGGAEGLVQWGGYVRFPTPNDAPLPYNEWDFSDSPSIDLWLDSLERLVSYGTNIRVLTDVPATNTYVPEDLVVVDEMLAPNVTEVYVAEGPECSTFGAEVLGDDKFLGYEAVVTWYYIYVGNIGSQVQGWFPESIVFYRMYDDPLLRSAETFYFLTPLNAFEMRMEMHQDLAFDPNPVDNDNDEDTCEDVPPSELAEGDLVHPAFPLNLRVTPGGERLSLVTGFDTLQVGDDSDCADGTRWIKVSTLDGREGWVAERDGTIRLLLSGPAPPDSPEETREPESTVETREPESTEETREPEPTREPDPTREPRPTEQPTRDPTTGG